MKVLVTGCKGQVAHCLAERGIRNPALEWHFLGRPQLDLRDDQSLREAVRSVRPHVLVSAAAYTAVDQAEQEEKLAFKVNGDAPGVLAEEMDRIGGSIIHLSTDYVFAGDAPTAYSEDDPTEPINVYGRSKLAGEKAVLEKSERSVVLRTSWIYSPFGTNFVKTMLRLAETRQTLSVVDDQFGSPTSAFDIAEAITTVLHNLADVRTPGMQKVYHVAGRGMTSWAGLARHIMECSRAGGGPWAEVIAIASAEFPIVARRPANSRLNSDLFARRFGYAPRHWEIAVADVVERLIR